jgi:hypothetical protein
MSLHNPAAIPPPSALPDTLHQNRWPSTQSRKGVSAKLPMSACEEMRSGSVRSSRLPSSYTLLHFPPFVVDIRPHEAVSLVM